MIGNIGQIDRGYERIDERLRSLGASIERTLTGAGYAPAVGTPRQDQAQRERPSRARGGLVSVSTGLSVLDHLVGELARPARLQLCARGRAGRRRPGGGRSGPERSVRRIAPLLRAPGAAGQRVRVAPGRRGARRRRARGLRPASPRVERRLLRASAASRSDVVAVFLEELAARRRPERPHPRPRGQGSPERAERDLQGARRGHRPGVPHAGRRSSMSKQVVRTELAPAPFQGAPYNQAIVANGFVFVAGQLGLDPATAQIVEGRDRAADRARVREPAGHPRGRRLVARPRRQDDRLPHEPRRLRRR